jgi:hypothetical protein
MVEPDGNNGKPSFVQFKNGLYVYKFYYFTKESAAERENAFVAFCGRPTYDLRHLIKEIQRDFVYGDHKIDGVPDAEPPKFISQYRMDEFLEADCGNPVVMKALTEQSKLQVIFFLFLYSYLN